MAVQEQLWHTLSDAVARVNYHVPKEHQYQYDLLQPDDAGGLINLSEDQLRIAGESLGAEIARLRAKNVSLRAAIGRSPSKVLERSVSICKAADLQRGLIGFVARSALGAMPEYIG